MAELTITLRTLPGTTRMGIRVNYVSDPDDIPLEHEADHKRLVKRLFPSLEIVDDREAMVRVSRERLAREPVVG